MWDVESGCMLDVEKAFMSDVEGGCRSEVEGGCMRFAARDLHKHYGVDVQHRWWRLRLGEPSPFAGPFGPKVRYVDWIVL